MKASTVILPLISAIILTFASCSPNYFTSDGYTWGTSYHIVFESNEPKQGLIDSCLQSIDAELSMFNSASTVSAVNAGATTEVSADFERVFAICHRVNEWSEGYYDPTVGVLSDLWGFGKGEASHTPTDSAIAAALETVGIAGCSITDKHIAKKSPFTVFDFSSVAKGYGIDRIADAFDGDGIENYLIEIGGEVLVKGHNPQGQAWHIQIDSPESGLGHTALTIAELGPEKTAMASSGNYRNYRCDDAGKIYGHTLSPLTGRPAQSPVIAATVIAPDCAVADALATACMAAPEEGLAWKILERAGAGVEALLVIADKNGKVSVKTTEGFTEKYIKRGRTAL